MVSRVQVSSPEATEHCTQLPSCDLLIGKFAPVDAQRLLVLNCTSLLLSLELDISRRCTIVQVNAGIDSLNAMCEEIGVPKLPYFHFLKGNNGVVAEFAANLTAQKLQQLRTQIAQHSAQ